MIRIFQVLLLAMIGMYILMLSFLILSALTFWADDNPDLEQVKTNRRWESGMQLGSVKFRKFYVYDSLAETGKMNHSISLPGASAFSREDGKLYVLNQHNEKVFVVEDLTRLNIILPISASYYSALELIAIIVMSITFILLIWITFLIFRFTQSALKKDFFTVTNMRRLRMAGWLITIFGGMYMIVLYSVPLLIRLFLHYTEIIRPFDSNIPVIPDSLLIGMLLLLIAKAFEKGIDLKEDNNSIV